MSRSLSLAHLIQQVRDSSFIEEYEASDEECLGLILAHHFEWAGEAVLDAAQYGLEDSNFHRLNEDINKLRKDHGLTECNV